MFFIWSQESDPEIRGGPVSKKIFQPFWPQFGRKINGAGVPGFFPGSATEMVNEYHLFICAERENKFPSGVALPFSPYVNYK